VTSTDTPETPSPSFVFDDPTGELAVRMEAYRPDCLPERLWLKVASGCIDLVKRAGAADEERVIKDLQVLAKTAAVLRERNRPLTLEEMLSDGGLRDLDSAEQRAGIAKKTRLNHRAVIHRLQATHRGLPWQPGRNKPQEQVVAEPSARTQLADLLDQAHRSGSEDARAFEAVMAAGDDARAGGGDLGQLVAEVWVAARRFADQRGVHLTQSLVKSASTERVLAQPYPLAVLIGRYRLTRRDLDLMVPAAEALPHAPGPAAAAALRGSS